MSDMTWSVNESNNYDAIVRILGKVDYLLKEANIADKHGTYFYINLTCKIIFCAKESSACDIPNVLTAIN